MEEILASIRKIISEDGAKLEPAPPAEDAGFSESDVLELVQEVTANGEVEAVAPPPPPETPSKTIPFEEAGVPVLDMKDMEETPPSPPVVTTMPEDNSQLVSQAAADASAQALSGLARMKNGSHSINSLPIGEGTRTVEDMVLQLLRPMLKEWLDRNLPTMVEHIVQKEIRKITRNLD